MYRHGDVIIKKVSKILGKKLNHLILAEGESTGHKHQVVGDAELYEENGVLYLHVEEESKVVHEEHKEIILPKGDYEITIQREYTPEGWKNVVD